MTAPRVDLHVVVIPRRDGRYQIRGQYRNLKDAQEDARGLCWAGQAATVMRMVEVRPEDSERKRDLFAQVGDHAEP